MNYEDEESAVWLKNISWIKMPKVILIENLRK